MKLIWFVDVQLCWTINIVQNIADKYKIQRYCLFTSPVNFLSFIYHLQQFHAEGRIPIDWEDEPLRIPNFPAIGPGNVPPSQHAASLNPNAHRFLQDEAEVLLRAAGVLVNSIYELESEVIEGLNHYLAEVSPDQVCFHFRIDSKGLFTRLTGDQEHHHHRFLNSRQMNGNPLRFTWAHQIVEVDMESYMSKTRQGLMVTQILHQENPSNLLTLPRTRWPYWKKKNPLLANSILKMVYFYSRSFFFKIFIIDHVLKTQSNESINVTKTHTYYVPV